MTKRVRKYFFDFMGKQQDWLNEMSAEGWRLVKCDILTYEFESCEPGAYGYRVDLANQRTFAGVKDYKAFLEETGYKVFYKNINLNWSAGKVVIRPRASGGVMLATSPGRYNKELFIVEKRNDGAPFRLLTNNADLARFYGALTRGWLYNGITVMGFAAVFLVLGIIMGGKTMGVNGWIWYLFGAVVFGAFAVCEFIQAAKYCNLAKLYKKLGETNE